MINEYKYKQYIWVNQNEISASSWQNQQRGCAPSEDSDQPGHPPSLMRVFAVSMKKAWVLSYPSSTQGSLWSVQSDLSLRWAHMPLCWFCHEAAHIKYSLLNRRGALCNEFAKYTFSYNSLKTWMQDGDTTRALGWSKHLVCASEAGMYNVYVFTVKILKIGTPVQNCCNYPKVHTVCFFFFTVE